MVKPAPRAAATPGRQDQGKVPRRADNADHAQRLTQGQAGGTCRTQHAAAMHDGPSRRNSRTHRPRVPVEPGHGVIRQANSSRLLARAVSSAARCAAGWRLSAKRRPVLTRSYAATVPDQTPHTGHPNGLLLYPGSCSANTLTKFAGGRAAACQVSPVAAGSHSPPM